MSRRTTAARLPIFLAVLLSAGAAAPPAGAQDPAFVGRGAPINAVDQGSIGTCSRYGSMDMWPDGRSVLAFSPPATLSHWLDYHPDGRPVTNDIGLIGEGDRVDIATTAATVPVGGFVATFTRRIASAADGLYLKIVHPEVAVPPSAFLFEGSTGVRSAVAAGDDGDFAVAWETCCPTAVWAARFDVAGNQLGADIPVAGVTGVLQSIDLTRAADGSFAAFWTTSQGALQYRRFSADGTPLEAVQTVAAVNPTFLRAAVATDGVLAYVYTRDGDALAARFIAADGQLGAEFTVFDQAASPALRASAAFLRDGHLAVAAQIRFDGGAGSVHLLRFGRDLQQAGSRVAIAIPTIPDRNFTDPLIAATEEDRVSVFYHVEDVTSPGCQIYSRRFDATLFADGFESGSLARWSGGG